MEHFLSSNSVLNIVLFYGLYLEEIDCKSIEYVFYVHNYFEVYIVVIINLLFTYIRHRP